MGMPNKRNYFNVTVVDRDVRAAFCGGKAALVFWLFVKSWGGILQNPALFLCLELFYVYKFYVDN